MDIFFVVSTVMSVLVGGLCALVLWKFLVLLRTLQRIAGSVEKEAGAIMTFFHRAGGRVSRFFFGKKKDHS